MKANRTYRNNSKELLEIMDTKIDSNSCCHVNVRFTIDARHILLAITCLMEAEMAKPNRKMIEERLKRELFQSGERWYTSPIDYSEEGEHWDVKEKLKKAIPIGKKFFPEFFNVPNSVKFMKDLA